MKILGSAFLEGIGCPMINTHPALLPSFPGTHGVADALAYGVKVTGATVHLVDAGVDTGPVLAQAPVLVEPGDDESSLHERIKIEERRMLSIQLGVRAANLRIRLHRLRLRLESCVTKCMGRETSRPLPPPSSEDGEQ